jgi:hypothetical protein
VFLAASKTRERKEKRRRIVKMMMTGDVNQ